MKTLTTLTAVAALVASRALQGRRASARAALAVRQVRKRRRRHVGHGIERELDARRAAGGEVDFGATAADEIGAVGIRETAQDQDVLAGRQLERECVAGHERAGEARNAGTARGHVAITDGAFAEELDALQSQIDRARRERKQ